MALPDLGQLRDDGVELAHRAGPTVHDQQGEDLVPGRHGLRLDVDEVDVEAGDVGLELRQRVEESFALFPVVLIPPKLHHLQNKKA